MKNKEMKLLTFEDHDEKDLLSVGITVSKFHGIVRTTSTSYTASAQEPDFFVGIGDTNMSTGRILLNRQNPPHMERMKIYTADIWRPKDADIESMYLIEEKDLFDTRLYVKLIDVANVVLKNSEQVQVDFHKNTCISKDDYLVDFFHGEKIEFESFMSDSTFFLINRRLKTDAPICIERKGTTFIIL